MKHIIIMKKFWFFISTHSTRNKVIIHVNCCCFGESRTTQIVWEIEAKIAVGCIEYRINMAQFIWLTRIKLPDSIQYVDMISSRFFFLFFFFFIHTNNHNRNDIIIHNNFFSFSSSSSSSSSSLFPLVSLERRQTNACEDSNWSEYDNKAHYKPFSLFFLQINSFILLFLLPFESCT